MENFYGETLHAANQAPGLGGVWGPSHGAEGNAPSLVSLERVGLPPRVQGEGAVIPVSSWFPGKYFCRFWKE